MPRFWIGTVSRSHVERGVDGGFAQLCHGKHAPLHRMQAGDWLIYYSPRLSLESKERCQQFTAIGQIKDDVVYQVEMSPDFTPFRRDVNFIPCQAASIRPLLDQLSFTQGNSNWGWLFHRGHFEISQEDFLLIKHAMQI